MEQSLGERMKRYESINKHKLIKLTKIISVSLDLYYNLWYNKL